MVSELLGISPRIRFLAVLLMDHFMDSHIVMEFRLQLVALTCLYVAGRLYVTIATVKTVCYCTFIYT